MQADLYSNPGGARDGPCLKYDYVFENGYVDKQDCNEGQFSALTSEGGNRKYTHHTVLVCIEVREMKSFRHLTTAEIVGYVQNHKHERGQHWRWGGPIRSDFEIWPERTICSLMLRSGISCVCCDEMVIPRREIDESDYSGAYEVDCELKNRNTASWLNKYDVPALCSECIVHAEREDATYLHWNNREEKYLLGALNGLIKRKYWRAA